MAEIYLGEARVSDDREPVEGGFVERDGERYYRIRRFDKMPPFFISLTSGGDQWMFLSSTGGLTCGRKNPENALFPYVTDDKIHDARSTTGPHTLLRVDRAGKQFLWKPFSAENAVYRLERSLYKNLPGNRIIFEEINHDLELVFSYSWACGDSFGFIRQASLRSLSSADMSIALLDGMRNILPYGVDRQAQDTLSTLVDAYKQAESVPEFPAAIYSLSSILTDRAEPSEALKSTIAWSQGLDQPQVLLSEDQVDGFCVGDPVPGEQFKCGKRGAFYVQDQLHLPAMQHKTWYLVADINQGVADVVTLLDEVRAGIAPATIEEDINQSQRRLNQLVGASDGRQYSADQLIAARHYSNTLFNIMRGGVFEHEYDVLVADFLDFVGSWNKPLLTESARLLEGQQDQIKLDHLMSLIQGVGNSDLLRLVYEYLPLVFSRRHGDPSRPWNHFVIDLENDDGSARLAYQGNWRDIFQNWEALAISYPEYIESFITKFVNASTRDGYNPYRISRDGIDWEVLDNEDPWSNIGYWGDHQVNYLVRLLQLAQDYHPGKLNSFLSSDLFVYANIPYRLKSYPALKSDPRNSVVFDDALQAEIEQRTLRVGSDGRLVPLVDGNIYHVNLLEKLLVPCLVKMCNLVPGGGIWMNTQRPEWNDANNALVGYGLSMVTLCFLRRYLSLLADLLEADQSTNYKVSTEVSHFFTGVDEVLKSQRQLFQEVIEDSDRKNFMDRMGALAEIYRQSVYLDAEGVRASLEREALLSFIDTSLEYLDQSIRHNRREDGLYHSYNLIQFDEQGYSVGNLDEMLEGQVAVLSSGCLDAQQSLDLLTALRSSAIYRADQNSYMLYPSKRLPGFLAKGVIPASLVQSSRWLQRQLSSGSSLFVEEDSRGGVHFNGNFKNAADLKKAMDRVPGLTDEEQNEAPDLYEAVFNHRQFTGRSGSMYKYEGLGSIYWHMVSKLLLAVTETIIRAEEDGTDHSILDSLADFRDDIKDGIGLHKSPVDYGAFPTDPYSHTPSFAGVQQPGMTGQVKEDVIVRFRELGVCVSDGEVRFHPWLLNRDEFSTGADVWTYSIGEEEVVEELTAGLLGFSLCGVPVLYRLAASSSIKLWLEDGQVETLSGNRLGEKYSHSLFRREGKVRKILVEVPESILSD